MLVLTRGVNEAIMVGDLIEITVLELKGGKVRLGIQAPAAVRVHRKEVWLEIRQANVEASRAAPGALDELDRLMGKKGEAPPKDSKEEPEGKEGTGGGA